MFLLKFARNINDINNRYAPSNPQMQTLIQCRKIIDHCVVPGSARLKSEILAEPMLKM